MRRKEDYEALGSCGSGAEGQEVDAALVSSRSEQEPMAVDEVSVVPAGLGRGPRLEDAFQADQGALNAPCQQYSAPVNLGGSSHDVTGTSRLSEEKDASNFSLEGLRLKGLGKHILQHFLEVLPFRSKTTGSRDTFTMFPLPTSRDVLTDVFPNLDDDSLSWIVLVALGLNSTWGGDLFSDALPTKVQASCLRELNRDVGRICEVDVAMECFQWDEFFRHRSVDYQGEEVKVARTFCWKNVAPALPAEIGRVPLECVCTLGAQYYVKHFDQYIKPRSEWPPISKPKVMVKDDDWGEVCKGLVDAGVCCLLPRDEVFEGPDGPLVNGLFGVAKDEMCDGVEVYRLIMNLIPLNSICYGIDGDVGTLPSWSMMTPLMLQPTESLVISSEDVRCFFYVMKVPDCWQKYLSFNKLVPDCALPDDLRGQEVYLASRVLPMGFVNSVSLAQHVHRNLALAEDDMRVNRAEAELRKDKPFTVANPCWRVYLDNFDVFEKVDSEYLGGMVGSLAPSILSLRSQYEVWDVPRNMKKAVSRQTRAEVQGAVVDGSEGVAYPRECKLLRYVGAALLLCQQRKVSQRQVQVVCGGLVYLSMFRRPLLGSLNLVWTFVESFNQALSHYQVMPQDCKLEVLRFLALLPLARMDFRLKMDPQITCSDASTSGGGLCASVGLTPSGVMASGGHLRGECPENQHEHRVLTIGLFDGVAALRVAMDLIEVDVIGHIAVEMDDSATRVTEANFPGTIRVHKVEEVTGIMVREWSCKFSQASLVLIGGGPPCQGVSGLNAERKGALRDARSGLFPHVTRISGLVKEAFPWAQVQTLMESVSSMDSEDRQVMSDDFGSLPWRINAGTLLWCNRPRLYWLTWEVSPGKGAEIVSSEDPQTLKLVAQQPLEQVTKEGWTKVDSTSPFPTFTTSRPRASPGYKPAGVQQCTLEDLQRWENDSYRFPPYQYCSKHCLQNRQGLLRVPTIEEREYMMGFPVGYTMHCLPKSQRKSSEYGDRRLTLIGNSWAVPVVAWLLVQLLHPLGLCREFSPQDIVNKLNPADSNFLQTRLIRSPLRPLRGKVVGDQHLLASKLCNLVSIKGEDIMVLGKTSEQVKFHRLRASLPSRLWKWKIIAGWSWKGNPEHINSLEMRAILTTLQWKIGHQGLVRKRFLHMTDSLVCLHSLTRGRSSSRKLRRTLCRINALLLVSSSQAFWSYVHTHDNPADRPSRWGRRVKTKFRNAR